MLLAGGMANGEFAPQGAYDAAAITYHCWATVHGIALLHTTVLRAERDDLLAVSRVILQKVHINCVCQSKNPRGLKFARLQ